MKKYDTVVELLSDESRWCQDKLRDYDENGNIVACCVEGAILEVYKDDYFGRVIAENKIHNLINNALIFRWNDDPNTTYEKMYEVVKQAKI